MQNHLVSVLTPMYNTEKYVHRLLDSVLSQDYPRIEMIVIDDGSTDGSRAVVEGYVSRFAEKGFVLRCVSQPNSGQSVAIRNGLAMISGEYLTWPDSDDYYCSDSAISRMVGVLESADEEFQMVRTQAYYVEDVSLKPLKLYGENAREEEDKSLFDDCLFGLNGYYYATGAYMIRTEKFRELTGFDIYTEKNAGQNWQMMAPILYKYRCKTILEPLFVQISRATSHSQGQYSGYERKLSKIDSFSNVRIETLKRIKGFPEDLLPVYRERFMREDRRWKYELALNENERKEAVKWLLARKGDMGKREFRITNAVLHLIGGTYLLKAYPKFHHAMSVLKKGVFRFFGHGK